VRENTSDEEDSEENMDPVIHRAYQARAQVNFVEHDDAYSGPSSKFIIKPYGRSHSGSGLKEELGRMRADILTTQSAIATALDRDDDGMPELISSDDELPTPTGMAGDHHSPISRPTTSSAACARTPCLSRWAEKHSISDLPLVHGCKCSAHRGVCCRMRNEKLYLTM